MFWWLTPLLLFSATISSESSGEPLQPFSQSFQHCGYKDTTGRVVVEPKLGVCSEFSEGVALVEERGTLWDLQLGLDVSQSPADWGYVDGNGKYVLKFKPRDYLPGGSFTEGVAPIYDAKTKKYGFIDHSGKIVIPAQFDHAESFSDGLAVVCSGQYHRPGESYWLTRKEALKTAGHKCGFADHAGQVVIAYTWNWVEGFHEGMARFREGREFGYIDKTGKVAIPARFASARRFSEGLAPVAAVYVYGYIDRTGTFVIPPRFKGAEPFSQGLAAVAVETVQQRFPGRQVSPVYAGHRLLYGYIDRQGKTVIAPEFLSAKPFANAKAKVEAMHAQVVPESQTVEINSAHAVINQDGTFAVLPTFPRIKVRDVTPKSPAPFL